MGVLLDSSWMKFGPAERDSLEWSPGPPPPTERLPDQTSPGESRLGKLSVVSVVTATAALLLLLGGVLGLLACRRRRAGGRKPGLLANVIALEDLEDLEDLQDPEVLEVLETLEDLRDPARSRELLSSCRRSNSRRWRSSSASSEEQDPADGVFLMVYLPSPYQHTITRLARAASTRSSRRLDRANSGMQQDEKM
ncbi:unnamed protein product [Arctogadus glacialis]